MEQAGLDVIEAMLDAKLEPLYKTQERIVGILLAQERHENKIEHCKEDGLRAEKANTTEHTEIFGRLRTLEGVNVEQMRKDNVEAHKTLSRRVDAVEKDSGAKLWDVLQMFLVALIAGVIGRFSK